ncbi:helix-turn-helix domain-containing protein [Kitasatospora sp. NBC_01250]|uniref:pyridoxamine 5'-phosphate oxidase family protein n=1 Tax=unclassified Kitasatospora TaxID=2633591 RepID=UPI002E11EC12|nr:MULTISPECIES: pyridoxamine 5'-phosphate oxidase family protein [unclassified Kitasatospora]WSJ65090.1 helix-turn-helix domain-containing protein [Kitasatospora sp. NBC_01302]
MTDATAAAGASSDLPTHAQVVERIRRRREELGLSREEVAHRAGMSLEYTHLLQRLDLDFHPAALRRIAAVLDLSYDQLMGEREESGSVPADARLMITRLTEQECWDALGVRNVGYLGYLDRSDAWAIPMDYLVDGRQLVYRITPTGPLATAPGVPALLESEGTSGDLRRCWNVLAAGLTTSLADADVSADLRTRVAAESERGEGEGERWMCLAVTRIAGRRIGLRQV